MQNFVVYVCRCKNTLATDVCRLKICKSCSLIISIFYSTVLISLCEYRIEYLLLCTYKPY